MRKAIFIMLIWVYVWCLKCCGALEVKPLQLSALLFLEKLPNFAGAAIEAVTQTYNTQGGERSLISNDNKIAFWPEVSMSLQVLVDELVPLYVREQTALQYPLKSLSCLVKAEEPFGV